ncbi:MAG TPA: cell division ATP-binding protein FtsE [Abditibacteriaceae bacterium]|nr:cell division ATP-binding protein FtsE [Abditibacteriaceae bacterium]
MIELQNVTVCYDPRHRYPVNAVADIDLKIEDGEWVFLVGPSGVGKSSILKLLYAGTRATLGQVTVDGMDVTHLPAREIPLLRRKIGVIFQDFQLLPQKTAWENVAFALQVIGARQSQIVREVPRALQTVGLTHRASARPHELSGGEQQRIAIARAIVNNPGILLADEPTGNLDPATAWEIVQVLHRIQQESGTTIIIATHDRSVVDAMRKRVVRLAEGRIISDENPGVYHLEDDPATPPALPALPLPEYSLPECSAPEYALLEPSVPIEIDAATSIPKPSTPPEPDAPVEPSTSVELSTPAAALNDPPAAPDVDLTRVANGNHAFRAPLTDPLAVPLPEPVRESYLEKMRRNEAPIGSTENPIVQFGPLDARE